MATPTIPIKTDARLIDKVLDELASKLKASLAWLDFAFGKGERLFRKDARGRVLSFPVIYTNARAGKDYFPLLPNTELGNFSWFDVQGPQTLQGPPGRQHRELATNVGLIVWFDFRKVYPTDNTKRTVENVKAEVLEALLSGSLQNGAFRLKDIEERAERVYRGYTIDEVDVQFRMRPYGCFRINMEIRYIEKRNC